MQNALKKQKSLEINIKLIDKNKPLINYITHKALRWNYATASNRKIFFVCLSRIN